MKTQRGLPSGGDRRREEGCIVCFEPLAGGEPLMIHVHGSPTKELGRAIDHALSVDPSYRMVSYSTPATIYADMTGARADRTSGDRSQTQRTQLPETLILSRLGRIDVLHPRLRGPTDARTTRMTKEARATLKAKRAKP